MDAQAGRRHPEARRLEDGPQRGQPIPLRLGPTGQDWAEELAGLALTVRQVAEVAEQEVGRQAGGSQDGGRRVEQVGRFERRPGRLLGRRSRAWLAERSRDRDGPVQEGRHPAGDREPVRIVVGRRGDHPDLEALGCATEGQAPTRDEQPELGPGLLAGGDVVGSPGLRLSGEEHDPRRTVGRQRVAPAGLLAGPPDGIVAGQLESEERRDPGRGDPLQLVRPGRRREGRAARLVLTPRREPGCRPGAGRRRAGRGSGPPRRPQAAGPPGRGRRSGRRADPR